MGVLIAIFIAKLIDIPVIILGAVAGYLARQWWHLVLGAVIAGTASELLLSLARVTYRFNAAVWIVGIVAGAVWAGGVWLLRSRFRRSSRIA